MSHHFLREMIIWRKTITGLWVFCQHSLKFMRESGIFFDQIFSSLLSAFRKRYNCQSNLLNMIEPYKNSLDSGEYVTCLSMDLIKALDCLPHCLTIGKLQSYGVSRDVCTLIASYPCSYKLRKRWRATACCGKSKFAIASRWLKKGSVSHPGDTITLP